MNNFVKNIIFKMSNSVDETLIVVPDESGGEDTETEESSDTGIASSGSDVDNHRALEATDCSAISNFFGYCFFKRVKKDSGRETKEKGNAPSNNSHGTGCTFAVSNFPDDSSQNRPSQKNLDGAPQGGITNVTQNGLSVFDSFKDEISCVRASDKSYVTAKLPTFSDTGENCCGDMETSQNGQSALEPKRPSFPVASYANALRNDPNQQRRASVKPCGHGTTAIAPNIPVNRRRKSNTESPPDTPQVTTQNGGNGAKRRESLFPNPDVEDKRTILAKNLINGNDEINKKNLINQEAKFQSQLNDVSKQLSVKDAEANKLRFEMEELQRDIFAKSAGMDRLQTELQTALKEADLLRQKLKNAEDDLANSKQKNIQLQENINIKTDRFNDFQTSANEKIAELQATIRALRTKIEALEVQLETLEKEKENLEKHRNQLIIQHEEERRVLNEQIDSTLRDKCDSQKKWEEDYEKVRTVNLIKEQETLNDFEWKLREIEQTCKKRLQEKDKVIQKQLEDAYRDAENKLKEAENIIKEVEKLKGYESEVQQLRDLSVEQKTMLNTVSQQLEDMKMTEESLRNESKRLRNLVDIEKENLQHIQRIHNQDLHEKERKLKELLHDQKTAIAIYWEEKLLQECRRLKSELDQIHYEERFHAIDTLKTEKEEEIQELTDNYEKKIKEHFDEIELYKVKLKDKDEQHSKQLLRIQTNTDRDIMELRRVMNKIDMNHHDRFEKLVQEHEEELDKINEEHEKQIKEIENNWQLQVSSMRTTVELVKEQMEKESQNKMQSLIEQHRAELDTQWANLIHQKSEAVKLVEEEYVNKYNTLEEQFYTQQKSHESREIELLKTIDALKNEITSKTSTVDDLQSTVDTLEGGIQILNQEIADHDETINKTKMDADCKIRNLQETIKKLQEQHHKQQEEQQIQFSQIQKQLQTTIDHLQRKCQCLNKLFEEVRARYERRESRQEDINTMADLRQIIAEQEKDLACLNEEKRFFQMKLMNLENFLDNNHTSLNEHQEPIEEAPRTNQQLSIPPTILECDDDFEDALT